MNFPTTQQEIIAARERANQKGRESIAAHDARCAASIASALKERAVTFVEIEAQMAVVAAKAAAVSRAASLICDKYISVLAARSRRMALYPSHPVMWDRKGEWVALERVASLMASKCFTFADRSASIAMWYLAQAMQLPHAQPWEAANFCGSAVMALNAIEEAEAAQKIARMPESLTRPGAIRALLGEIK